MFTEPMLRLFAIVLNRDAEKVTEALLMSGDMECISSYAFPPDSPARQFTDTTDATGTGQQLVETRKRIERFLSSVAVTPDIPATLDTTAAEPCNTGAINRECDAIADEQQKIRDRQRLLQNDIIKYEEILRQLSMYGTGFSPATLHTDYSYVAMQLGSLPLERLATLQEQIQSLPALLVQVGEQGHRYHMVAISMKRDRDRIAKLLSGNGWQPVELTRDLPQVGGEIAGAIDEKLHKLHTQQQELRKKGNEVVLAKAESLTATWVRLRTNELRLKINTTFKHTAHTVVFSGWIPAERKNALTDLLDSTTRHRCFIEWLRPGETSDLHEAASPTPVKLNNPKVLAPFEMLVANFGIPEYGTIDPTPFVVVTYLTMFGVMFADIGQGAILLFAGIAGTLFLKKAKKGVRQLAALLIWCGGASMLFGALFGSVFGYSIVKPLWFDFHGVVTGHAPSSSRISSLFDILGITVKFGIGVITCGLLFNWINLVIKRRWTELLFDKGGLPGGWMYGGGIYCAWHLISHDYRELPAAPVLLAGILVPALLLFFKAPLHARAHRTPLSAMQLLNFIMEWIVELLEVFGGYLSNTLSFMRVAGLGIAHVSLMVSFFTMADMVRGTSPGIITSILAILLIVAGNVMVIVLEGLSAGIQSLRLNYYEFFTKFFHGTGKLYQPVRLKEP